MCKKVSLIAIAEDNRFRNSVHHSEHVKHDMMIDPELASLPYDTEKKNISQELIVISV